MPGCCAAPVRQRLIDFKAEDGPIRMRLENKHIPVSLPRHGLERADLVATVCGPDGGLGEDATVLVCWPGGSYARQYWDFPMESYNFAEYLAAKGYLVIAVDPLGVGDSTRPQKGDDVGLELMAEAADELVKVVRLQLSEGTFDQQLPAGIEPRVVGVGHSMGAILTTVQQARHSSYDAVAILGNAVQFRDTSADGDTSSMSVSELMESLPAQHVRSGSIPSTWDREYVMLDRAVMRGAFHMPDVPPVVVEADDALAVEWPRRPIVEAAAGFTARYAPSITVPVFLGLGAIDLTVNPRAEVMNYAASSDITLLVMQRSGHCHNFSTDRHLLWDRMDKWL